MGSVSTNSLYDGPNVEAEWQNGSKAVQYLWGPSVPVRHNGQYPLPDAQGNTRVVADSGGNPTCFLNADASGIEWGSGGGTSDPYAWGGDSGYRMDGDGPAGGNPYYKVGCRFYDQDYARFLSRDTDLSQSPYAYCDGDPVNNTDPSGHKPTLDDLLGLGVTLGGGLGTCYGAYQALNPVSTVGQTTTTTTFSFLGGLVSYSSTSTTTFASEIGMSAVTKSGWIGVYAAGLAATCYGAYNLSNSFTSNTAPGRAMINGLGRALYRLQNL